MYGVINLSFATACLSSMMLTAVLAQDQVCDSVPSNFYLCGDELADIVELLCGIGYVGKRDTKAILGSTRKIAAYKRVLFGQRNIPSHVLSQAQQMIDKAAETAKIRAEKQKNISKLKQIILNKRQAYQYIGGVEPGIVCECCFHSCGTGELLQYCQN